MAKSNRKISPVTIGVTGLKFNFDGLKQLEKKLLSLPSVDVGYLKAALHPTWDMTYAEIAALNHFYGKSAPGGSFKIPERPAMAQAFESNNNFVDKLQAAVFSAMSTKGQINTNRAFSNLGRYAVYNLNMAVLSGSFVGNAEYTIEKKGRDDPLNWTGALAKAAKFRLVKGR